MISEIWLFSVTSYFNISMAAVRFFWVSAYLFTANFIKKTVLTITQKKPKKRNIILLFSHFYKKKWKVKNAKGPLFF